MRSYLTFIVIGLTTGAVYALSSLGLVLTYITSGVFNFAHGAVGMFAAYVFFELRAAGVPTALCFVVVLFGVAPLMGLIIDRVLLRRLEGATAVTYVVASVGLLVGLQGLAAAIWGASVRRETTFLPSGTYRLLDVNVGYDQTIIVAVSLAAGLALLAFFRWTHLGLETRAVVSDKALTGLVGSNASRVTMFSWMLGSSFAALSGILFVPLLNGLDPLLLTLLVVQAFGAAMVGRLRSLSLTMAGAFGLGVAQSLAVKFVSEHNLTSLQGLPTGLPFLVLFGILVFSRRGAFPEATKVRTVPRVGRSLRSAGARFPCVQGAVALALTAGVAPFLGSSKVLTLSNVVAFVLVFSSLGLLVGLSRQVSLAHAAFVSLGATTCSHLLHAGAPFPVALLIGGAALIPLGALLAIPAIRLAGLFLALATLGFAILMQNVIFPMRFAFGSGLAADLPRPSFLSSDLAFYYFLLGVVTLGLVAIEVVRVTRLGRTLRALADSPTAVTSLGVSPLAARILAFCLSAFFAGIAGGLLGALVGSVTTSSFHFFESLVWVAVLVVAGPNTFGGAVLAALLLVALPSVFDSPTVTEWQPVVFGVTAMLLAASNNGLIGLLRLPEWRGRTRSERRPAGERELEHYLELAGLEEGIQPSLAGSSR